MASTTLGVKVDDLLRSRLADAAARLERTPHWLIKQAIFAYLERIEHGQLPPELSGHSGVTELADGQSTDGDDDNSPHPFLEFAQNVQPQSVLRAAIITAAYRRPEPECVPFLLAGRRLPANLQADVQALATKLVEALREKVLGRRRRRADPRILAVEPGRRRADVPRRSAAAHSRSRDSAMR